MNLKQPSSSRRLLLGIACFLGLAGVYISQQYNYLAVLVEWLNMESTTWHPYTFFVFNKYLRFIMNDTIMVAVIWLIFQQRKYVKLAFGIEMFGLLIIMPIYLTLKLNLEGDSEISSPLLSFIHRLIVNPTLLILLIPAIYYQERIVKNN